MNIKKYTAATSREAMRQVKNELGADAVILSNRKTANGVEIMALADSDISTLATRHETKFKVEPETASFKVASPPTYTQPLIASPVMPQVVRDPEPQVSAALVRNIINEVKSMRSTMEDQLAAATWADFTQRSPVKTKILRTLLNVGFSPLLSRRLVDKLPESYNYEQSLKKAMSALAFNLKAAVDDEIIENGGVYALVGPTGVGKTTTTAKLAARCVIRHGADKVALLTTDSYRIGGHEQLRIYGKLLGIPVNTIKDVDDLQLTLSELASKHLVLIDTVGMSQRDQMVAEQIAMLSSCGSDVKRLLLLSATSNGNTLDEVISAYQSKGIHGCLVTKVDEAASLGATFDVIIRNKLKLHYVSNGQKVPEDLHSANSKYLLHRAFKAAPGDSPFSLQDTEFALLMTDSDKSARRYSQACTGVNRG